MQNYRMEQEQTPLSEMSGGPLVDRIARLFNKNVAVVELVYEEAGANGRDVCNITLIPHEKNTYKPDPDKPADKKIMLIWPEDMADNELHEKLTVLDIVSQFSAMKKRGRTPPSPPAP